jgi:formate hydrogenlyase transcriptional activator
MFEEIVGSCAPMRQVLKQIGKVAPSDSTVLILGETGTGKELIARALHRRSNRSTRAFVRLNCAAIPQSLIASEGCSGMKKAYSRVRCKGEWGDLNLRRGDTVPR